MNKLTIVWRFGHPS